MGISQTLRKLFRIRPDIENLISNRDVEGLIEALSYNEGNDLKKDIEYQGKIAIALGNLGDARAIRPLEEKLRDLDNVDELLRDFGSRISHSATADNIKLRELNNESRRAIRVALDRLRQQPILGVKESSQASKQFGGTKQTPSQHEALVDLSVLDSAYLVRQNDELEKKVNLSLDKIASKGEPGIKILVDRLYRDMTLSGNRLSSKNFGDMAWNEWLKRREVVRALERAKAKSAIPDLIVLLKAGCPEGQFYEILQPAVAHALGEIWGPEAIEELKKVRDASPAGSNTWKAAAKAMENLKNP